MGLGQAILERAFENEGYGYSENIVQEVLSVFNQTTAESLCAEVGAGHITGQAVVESVFPGIKEENKSRLLSFVRMRARRKKSRTNDKTGKKVAIKGMIPGMALHYAGCCHALPGDRIVGIVTKGRGMTIHTIDCETLEGFQDAPERWIDVAWDQDGVSRYDHTARIHTILSNTPGSLGTLSTVIGRDGGNISNLMQ